MATIIISEYMSAAGIVLLEKHHEIVYDAGLWGQRNRLQKLVAGAVALIVRNQTRVDALLLDGAPNLQAVGRLGVGLDNIDTDTCRARGIAVHAAAGANAIAVAEYVIGSLFMLTRKAYAATSQVVAGGWPREESVGGELTGKCLGLVGFGTTAREVAKRADALGMTVTAHDPFVAARDPAWSIAAPSQLDELIASSDAISIHLPLNEATRNLIDAAAIAKMRHGAILVNTSRGGIVDEVALVRALAGGALGGAAVDVFEHEPLDKKTGALFANIPNLILTPHIAGHTAEANNRVAVMVAGAVLETLEAD